jgi:dsRNA-specific ribonuclease
MAATFGKSLPRPLNRFAVAAATSIRNSPLPRLTRELAKTGTDQAAKPIIIILPMAPKQDDATRREQAEAWVGDAVLGLFVRELILREDNFLDGEKFSRFTSNSMLSDVGNPTAVEAEIGRVYKESGIEAGFRHIEEKILPVMRRREKAFQNTTRQRNDAKKQKTKRTRWAR